MKTSVLIIALLFVFAQCQEQVVSDWTGSFTTGTRVEKVYKNSNWDSYTDFAVYGWMKINSGLPRGEWSTVLHFTSNVDGQFSDYAKPGDRVLSLFMINNSLHSPTYTNGNTNYHNDLTFANEDLDKWAFFYIAVGQAEKRRITYYNLGSSGPKQAILDNIVHQPSNYYKLMVGQSVNYRFFPGSLARVTIHAGPGAYREKNFEQIQGFNPSSVPTCPILYTGCSYSGDAVQACESIPKFDVNQVKSIYLPANTRATFFDDANFKGKKVIFNQSIDCITAMNWSALVKENAITVTDIKQKSLKRNQI